MKLLKRAAFAALSLLLISSAPLEEKFEMITPSSEINKNIEGLSVQESEIFRYETTDAGVILDPQLPADWTWAAGKGLEGPNGRIDFFFWNGLLFTNSEDVKFVSFRIRTFPTLFTDKIESNAFVIGFEKPDKGILFVATDEPKEVYVKMPAELMGREMVYNFYLGKNEAKMFRITRKTKPFLP